MTIIKLCGMGRMEDIERANEIRPDYVGFIFAKGTKRYIAPGEAKKLKQALHPDIKAVGVFVDEDVAVMTDLVNQGIIDCVQLHGQEDNGCIEALRAGGVGRILQAFRIHSAEDLARVRDSKADLVLLDSGAGSGKRIDVDLLRNYPGDYILAGGLDPDNVAEAIRLLHPYGVDVSSGIETDGRKDLDKMEAFVKAVRKEDTV